MARHTERTPVLQVPPQLWVMGIRLDVVSLKPSAALAAHLAGEVVSLKNGALPLAAFIARAVLDQRTVLFPSGMARATQSLAEFGATLRGPARMSERGAEGCLLPIPQAASPAESRTMHAGQTLDRIGLVAPFAGLLQREPRDFGEGELRATHAPAPAQ